MRQKAKEGDPEAKAWVERVNGQARAQTAKVRADALAGNQKAIDKRAHNMKLRQRTMRGYKRRAHKGMQARWRCYKR